MRTLLGIALFLVILWVVARIVVGVTTLLLNLVLIGAVLLFAWAIIRAVLGTNRGTPPPSDAP
jgi:hypothetical protein